MQRVVFIALIFLSLIATVFILTQKACKADNVFAGTVAAPCKPASESQQVAASDPRLRRKAKKKIIMMISQDCSGSSAVHYTLRVLLELHGIAVYAPVEEFLKDAKAVKVQTCYKSGNDNSFSAHKVARLEQAWNVLVNKSGCDPDLDLPTQIHPDYHTYTHTHTHRERTCKPGFCLLVLQYETAYPKRYR